MENKPIVTCHGDQSLFAKLHPTVIQGLPREAVEWRRSYGRAPRTVYVEVSFVPFSLELLPKDDDWTLLGRTFFHIYWTECDVDTYKSYVKDDITSWLSLLRNHNISDWLIVVVVNDESKVKTKLLRTSVIDKVRSDFCSKQTDRCIVLTEPYKTEVKAAESWGNLLSRMRSLLLQSYNRSLSRFEEHMRAQRERRTEQGWNFCHYFMLQEELAFMFEMLGLFEEALVQYDELDALFTQFILNHAAGDIAEWITAFTERKCTSWDGLCLSRPINIGKRKLIQANRASLLDFRNYLYSRQCTLLFLLIRPWEVAQRSIPFMHNCIQELHILDIKMPPGSVACWVFLSCLEVLNTCDRFKETGHVETYSLYTANLWDYARKKIHELGVLCGLMPSLHPSSTQLNLVVDLISGMGASQDADGKQEPMDKLREALSSKDAFRQCYMELSELAMGTYKHIGRIRSARLIGKDLANFYMKLGEPHHAEGFLMDALKTYRKEGWTSLLDNTQIDIAECQKTLGNQYKYVKACMHIASSIELSQQTREHYMKEMMTIAQNNMETPFCQHCLPVFCIKSATLQTEKVIQADQCLLDICIENNMPQSVNCDEISISLVSQVIESHTWTESCQDKKCNKSHSRTSSISSSSSGDYYWMSSGTNGVPGSLDIQPHVETRDKAVMSSGLVCKTALRRLDSGSTIAYRDTEAVKEDYTLSMSAQGVELLPGNNTVTVKGMLEDAGYYHLGQLCVCIQGVEFVETLTSVPVTFKVHSDEPSVILKPVSDPLLAGVPQRVDLILNPGSHQFDETDLKLHCSDGLQLHHEGGPVDVIKMPAVMPYQQVEYTLTAVADLGTQSLEFYQHQVQIDCDWSSQKSGYQLTFQHPLQITHHLHTAGKRKYIQIVVQSSTNAEFLLSQHRLETNSKDFELVPLNRADQTMVVNAEQTASYLWQLQCNLPEGPAVECTYSIGYQTTNMDQEIRQCAHTFTLQEYQTLLCVKSEVMPPEGASQCKAGSLCQLRLHISSVQEELLQPKQFMYEVVCDNTYWAVCGKTSGMFGLEEGQYQVSLDVMPLLGGFLRLPAVKIKYIPQEMSMQKLGVKEAQREEEAKELDMVPVGDSDQEEEKEVARYGDDGELSGKVAEVTRNEEGETSLKEQTMSTDNSETEKMEQRQGATNAEEEQVATDMTDQSAAGTGDQEKMTEDQKEVGGKMSKEPVKEGETESTTQTETMEKKEDTMSEVKQTVTEETAVADSGTADEEQTGAVKKKNLKRDQGVEVDDMGMVRTPQLTRDDAIQLDQCCPIQQGALPHLVAFSPYQVYNSSLGKQVHVLPTTNTSQLDITVPY